MRWVVWLLVLFAVAVVVALFAGANPGLVSFFVPPWRFDVSLNFFVLAGGALLVAGYWLLRGISGLLNLPRAARRWRALNRERRANADLVDAVTQYFAGRYTRTIHSAKQSVEAHEAQLKAGESAHVVTEFGVLANLMVATGAHRLQDHDTRESYFQRALEVAATSRVREAGEGVRLQAVQWRIDDHEPQEALRELDELPPGVSRRAVALRMRLKAARLANEPEEALRTARLLAKHQGFRPDVAKLLLGQLATDSLKSARSSDQLRGVWLKLEKEERTDAHVVACAARLMAGFGEESEAREWIATLWPHIADMESSDRQALCEALDAALDGVDAAWLERLEKTYLNSPNQPILAYLAGRCCEQRQIWGKARQLFERCAANEDLPLRLRQKSWLALARVAEQAQDTERAYVCYKAAAQLID